MVNIYSLDHEGSSQTQNDHPDSVPFQLLMMCYRSFPIL